MAEFRFTNEHSSSELGNVIDVLRRPRLWVPTEADYPDHAAWLEKVEAQLGTNQKRAMVAYDTTTPIGAVVYQRHLECPKILEIRNISVAPESHGRYMGSFLLRNTEIEGIGNDFPGVDTVMVDTKVTNTGMITFLLHHGYKVEEVADLYGKETGLDVVLTKPITA
jgi:ribosomal protein S18 acetylase RimI-like enzyme